MSTIHLTDAQRDTFAACGLIVIDGEPHQCPDDGDPCYHPIHTTGPVAQEGWRILTEPCDTCHGVGKKRRMGAYGPYFDQHGATCPDCVGGRRVFALEHDGEMLGRFVLLALTPNDDGTFTASVEAVD